MKVEARVRCGGHLHRIVLTDKGRLRLCDHPRRFWKTLAMQQAVGMECRCAEVLRAWRHGDREKLPKKLRDAVSAQFLARENSDRGLPNPDALAVPLHDRLHQIAYGRAKAALDVCHYRTSHSRVGGEHTTDLNVYTLGTGRPQCDGGSDKVWNPKPGGYPGRNSWWQVSVKLSWLTRVYKLGLATLEGRFVLDAEPHSDRVWKIDYVAQGRGFQLVKKHGFAVQQLNGSFTLARHAGQVQHVYL